MTTLASLLIGGALLGLAGSLHCAAMCGGLASGGALLFVGKSRLQSIVAMAMLMSGRIAVYAGLGALLAASADLTIAIMSMTPSVVVLPWIGAVMLVWIGLSTAGFFPAFAVPQASSQAIISAADRFLQPVRQLPHVAPFATGVLWGLTPCPLVYAGLFTAALTGSALSGFIWMLGFGLATVPAVVLPALGIHTLARLNAGARAKTSAGLAIALFGVAMLLVQTPAFSLLCAST